MEPKFNKFLIYSGIRPGYVEHYIGGNHNPDNILLLKFLFNKIENARSRTLKNDVALQLNEWLRETFGELGDFFPGHLNTRLDAETYRFPGDKILYGVDPRYDVTVSHIEDHTKSKVDPAIMGAQQKLINAIVPWRSMYFRGDKLEIAIATKALAQMVKKKMITSETARDMLHSRFDLGENVCTELLKKGAKLLESQSPPLPG